MNMRKLMTGYVIHFNRRHKRYGHLFQNRFKSIGCEEETYLLELTRYIHLNPLRGGLVEDLPNLKEFPWSAHAVLMERMGRDWQDTDSILSLFDSKLQSACEAYERFVAEGVQMGQRPELVGGGLIRRAGGWSEVMSLRRHNIRTASAETRLKETLRLNIRKVGLSTLAW
jgi:putative transposase